MSDQDFFFDDEAAEAKPAEKAAPAQQAAKQAPRPKATAAPAGAQTVTMTVAGLIGVVALLVGIIVGILIPTGGNQAGSPAGGLPSGMETGGGSMARPLSPEELEGGMPEGHPPVDSMGEPGAMPPTGEATDTAAPEGESE